MSGEIGFLDRVAKGHALGAPRALQYVERLAHVQGAESDRCNASGPAARRAAFEALIDGAAQAGEQPDQVEVGWPGPWCWLTG